MAKAKNHKKSNKPHQKPRITSTLGGLDGLREQAYLTIQERAFRHWRTESKEIEVSGLSETVIREHRSDTLFIPTLYAAPLYDFSAEIPMDNGSIVKMRFAKEVHADETLVRRLAKAKVEPCATIYAEYEGVRQIIIMCHDPSKPLGHCTKPVPISEDKNHSLMLDKNAWQTVYNAILQVQYYVLNRKKVVKHMSEQPETDKPPQRRKQTAKQHAPKTGASSVITLGQQVVNVYTHSKTKMRWTQWWIVGSHYAVRHTSNGNKRVKIEAYAKGPEKDSAEAQAALEQYRQQPETLSITVNE